MARTLDGDALDMLDGEIDGFNPGSPFNPTHEEMGLRHRIVEVR